MDKSGHSELVRDGGGRFKRLQSERQLPRASWSF